MPGLKIVIETGAAERGARQLKKDLESLGSSAVENEKEFKKLKDRMEDGLKADKAKKSIDSLQKSLNMTRLETVKFKASIGDYKGAVESLTSGAGKAAKNFALLGSAMSAVAVGGMAAATKSMLLNIAEMQKSADMAGVSVKAYQELSYAAQQYSVTQDALTDGIKELNLRAKEFVLTGEGPGAAAFERLNYTQDQLKEGLKDTPKLLLDIIDRLHDMDTASQLLNADEIFGGQGGEQFVSMIKAGSKEIEKFSAEITNLGGVLSDEAADNAIKANRAINNLTTQLKTQFAVIVGELAPDIQDVSERMGEWVGQNKDLIAQKVPEVFDNIATGLGKIKGFYDNIPDEVKGPAGVGLIGTVLFGPKGGLILGGAADYLNRYKRIAEAMEGVSAGFLDPKVLKSGSDELEKALVKWRNYKASMEGIALSIKDLTDRYKKKVKEGIEPAVKANKQLAASVDEVEFAYKQFYDEINMTDKERRMLVDPDEFAKVKKILEDQADLKEKLYKEELDQQKELAEAQQDAYEEIYGTVKGFTRDVLDDWESMGDTLVDLSKSLVKDLAATFLTTNLVMPVTLAVGSSMGLTAASGVPYSSIPGVAGGGGFNGLSLLSNINTGYNALSGGLSSSVGNFLGSGLPNQIVTGLFGASAWGGGAAPTYLTGAGGSMISVNSGLAGGALSSGGASGIVGGLSAAAPFLAAAAIALPLITSFFESEPEPRLGIRKGDLSSYGFNAHTQDVGGESEIKKYITDYYEGYFAAIDEITTNSVADVLNDTDWERLRVHPEDFDSIEDAVFALNDTVFKKFSDGFISGLADGQLSGYLDESFFEEIKGENESLFDSFIRVGVAIEETDSFVSQFTDQIDSLGISAVDAFENVSLITSVLAQVDESIDGIATVSAVSTLNTLTDSWNELIQSLETAHATTEQITKAETGRSQVLGSNITGLTASSLQSALVSGKSIDSLLDSAIQGAGYAEIAQKITSEYITELNEAIGDVWLDSDGDIQAVMTAMQAIDTTDVKDEIDKLQKAFGLLESEVESVTESITADISEATRTVTLAIKGQLTAAQQFEAWQIDNVQAANLFSEITANGVTQDELEKAVDSFAELGITGADLNSVISDLADRFSSAADDIVESISNITSAQGNLASVLGDDLTTAETLESLQTQFRSFRSWSEILGSDTVTKQVEVKPTTADYEDLVNDLFKTMFGRKAASAGLDYWVKALKDESDDVDYSNIMQALLDGAKASAKSGNLLSAKDLIYYAAAQPTIKEVNPLESTYETQTRTVAGSISSDLEKSIYETMAALEDLPNIVTNGVVNESNIAEWVDVISSANNEALNKLFGEDSETMINSLANAIDDYNAVVGDASDSTNSLSKAIDNTQELMDDYISYLEIEIDTRATALDNATGVLKEYLENEESLIDARKEASEDINDFINGLYGSTSAPVQSMEFFEKRYSQLLQDAKNADADDVGEAVSNLTSFASKYLDFAGSYDTNNYSDLFSSVTSDLSAVADLQAIFARVEERGLEDVAELIGYSNDELIDINEAIQAFKTAEMLVDDSAWMTEELEKLGAIEDNLSLLLESQTAYYSKIGSDVPDSAKFNTIVPELLMKKLTMSQSANKFAGGGIISGPSSGYTMPTAEFHGTEAIIPLSNGSVPVTIQTPVQSTQNVQVKVYLDGKELKNVVVKTIKTDPEAQVQIRRVANG